MNTPGRRPRAAGLIILLISIGAGINFAAAGAFGFLLCFAGVLAGGTLVAIGVHMGNDPLEPAPAVPAVFDGARALAASVRRSLDVVGLGMASCAVAAVSGEASPVLCFAMFALLLLGLSLINIGFTGE